MAEDLGERSELPTPRKLDQARQRGQVAKSQDLGAAVDLIGAAVLVVIFGSGVMGSMVGALRVGLSSAGEAVELSALLESAGRSVLELGLSLGPILGLMCVAGFLGQFMQVGPLLTFQPLEPKLDRLDPIRGTKNLVTRKNLVKTLMNVAKLAVVITVSWLFLSSAAEKLVNTPRLEALAAFALLGRVAIELTAWLLAMLLAIGVLDFLYQKWQYTQDQKMTKDEVKDERRGMEGDPEIKSRRFRMAREIATQRINAAVPQADVVVTNPTHVSVALRYDAATMRAPRVVAKGADYLAMRIRQVAMVHAVPIVERPPLARALYAQVEVGREISPEYYEAVAEVLAYVYRLEQNAAQPA
jgi:flagellar biosynthetic protein FlhB